MTARIEKWMVLAAFLAMPSSMAMAQQSWTAVVAPLDAQPPQPRDASPQTAAAKERAASKATAEPNKPALPATPAPPRPKMTSAMAAAEQSNKAKDRRAIEPGLARDYCVNIADAAADARFAWQKKTLADLEKELGQRIALLDQKIAEYQRWVARRDEFSQKARENLVIIYSRMRPDAAAAQLTAIDLETAAAVLTKLDPRNASAILNEMDPTYAARLTGTIAGAASPSPPTPSAKPRLEEK